MLELMYKVRGKDEMHRIWHRSEGVLLLSYTDGGSIVFSDRCFPLRYGTLCYIPEGIYHYTAPDNAQTYLRSKIVGVCGENNLFRTCFDAVGKYKDYQNVIYSNLSSEQFQKADEIFLALKEHLSPLHELSLIAELLDMLVTCSVDAIASYDNALSKAVVYINEHISDPLTLDMIAAAANFNKSYLCRLFKQKIGMTPMNYIVRTRITVAKDMLVKTELPVGQISAACGFSGDSFFCRTFKAQTGMSALEYRRTGGENR